MLIDVRQHSPGPVRTKAHFDIWNQNEDGLSGTIRCITCWDQTLLGVDTKTNQTHATAGIPSPVGKGRTKRESVTTAPATARFRAECAYPTLRGR
jgi:hypothetical protein